MCEQKHKTQNQTKIHHTDTIKEHTIKRQKTKKKFVKHEFNIIQHSMFKN